MQYQQLRGGSAFELRIPVRSSMKNLNYRNFQSTQSEVVQLAARASTPSSSSRCSWTSFFWLQQVMHSRQLLWSTSSTILSTLPSMSSLMPFSSSTVSPISSASISQIWALLLASSSMKFRCSSLMYSRYSKSEQQKFDMVSFSISWLCCILARCSSFSSQPCSSSFKVYMKWLSSCLLREQAGDRGTSFTLRGDLLGSIFQTLKPLLARWTAHLLQQLRFSQSISILNSASTSGWLVQALPAMETLLLGTVLLLETEDSWEQGLILSLSIQLIGV